MLRGPDCSEIQPLGIFGDRANHRGTTGHSHADWNSYLHRMISNTQRRPPPNSVERGGRLYPITRHLLKITDHLRFRIRESPANLELFGAEVAIDLQIIRRDWLR